MNKEMIMEGVKLILQGIGEDVNREGLIETPDRIARMYMEIFEGIGKDAKDVLSKTFTVENNDLVLEKDITFFSMCEHHLVPFFGKAHIAYIPKGKVACKKTTITRKTYYRNSRCNNGIFRCRRCYGCN